MIPASQDISGFRIAIGHCHPAHMGHEVALAILQRSQGELGRRCLKLWLQSGRARHGGRNYHLGTSVRPGFHDLIDVRNHCFQKATHGLRSAKRWYASIFSSWGISASTI